MFTLFTQLKMWMLIVSVVLMGTSFCEADYVGPTDNITKVANAVRIRSKSLSTIVEIKPGLTVTQPVEISVGYYSPAGSYRVSQTYSASAGNRIFYDDHEGDGKARQVRIDISFVEKKPVGRPYLFGITKNVDLDPLYSLSFGPLSFSLLSACDSIGDNEIRLLWKRFPDRQDSEKSFSLASDKIRLIQEFAGSATEISPSKKPQMPLFYFEERDPGPTLGTPDYRYQGGGALVLGKSHTVRKTVTEATKKCTALVQYSVQSNLVVYTSL